MSDGSLSESTKTILSIWGFALIFTLVSIRYVESPLIFDAEIVYYGFPFRWLEMGRSTWIPNSLWHYNFLWFWFIVDFVVYAIFVLAAIAIYDKTLRNVNRTRLYKAFFLASSIGFVFLYWFPLLVFETIYVLEIPIYRSYYTPPSFVPYLLAELTVVYVWSLMKCREIITKYRQIILAVIFAIIAIFILNNIIAILTTLSR